MPRVSRDLKTGLCVLVSFACAISATAQTGRSMSSDQTAGPEQAAPATTPAGTKPGIFDKMALLFSREIREIDARREELYRESLRIPAPPRGQQGNRFGYHSAPGGTTNETKWITLDLGRATRIDSIVLVPADAPFGFFTGPGYGFPPRFRVEISNNTAFDNSLLVVDNTRDDFPNPGGYPLQFPAAGTVARYVRVTATRLWPRNQQGVFALGELMVLSGPLNVATGLPASALQVSDSFEQFPTWGKANLVDGQSVLGAPVTGPASPSMGFQSEPAPRADAVKWVQVDLGRECELQEIRLFPARPRGPSEPLPFGFPWEMRVEAADEPDFKSPVWLATLGRPPVIRPTASPVTIRAEGRRARFVRVTATRLSRIGPPFIFALSEFQVYAEGENVAASGTVKASDSFEDDLWSRRFLLDGFNSQRRLAEWPDWIRELARRGEAERESRELLVRRDRVTYALIGSFIRWTSFLTASFVLLAAVLIWRSHLARQRALEELRTRIARDIHDEIGSGLGTITMLSQLAQRQPEIGAQAKEDLEEIHRVARDLSESMRDIAWLNRAGNSSLLDLHLRMHETAKTMLPGVALDFPLEKRDAAQRLSLKVKRQLFLIFKEAIHNVLKHAQATRVVMRLGVEQNGMVMCLHDNGRGFDAKAATSGTGLSGMRDRAEALRGTFVLDSQPGQGATLTVRVPNK
jgi:signal transduction histidine kinase